MQCICTRSYVDGIKAGALSEYSGCAGFKYSGALYIIDEGGGV